MPFLPPKISPFDRQMNAHFRGAPQTYTKSIADIIRVWHAFRPTDFWSEQHVAVIVRDFGNQSDNNLYFEMIEWLLARGFKIKEYATRREQRFFTLKMNEEEFFEFKMCWL